MTDTDTTDRPPCGLCGIHGRPDEIRLRVVEWIDPVPGHPFDPVPRCEDRAACRQRVTAKRERWPVVHMSGDPWPVDELVVLVPLPPSPAEPAETLPDPEPPIPATWSPSFVDEPEEERSWI